MPPSVQRLFDDASRREAQKQPTFAPRFGAIGERPPVAAPVQRHAAPRDAALREHEVLQRQFEEQQELQRQRHMLAQEASQERLVAPDGVGVEGLTAQIDRLLMEKRGQGQVQVQGQGQSEALFTKRRAAQGGGGGGRERGNGNGAGRRAGSQMRPSTALAPKRVRVTPRTTARLPDVPAVRTAPPHVFELLNRQVWELYDQIRPEDGEGDRRARLLAHMNKLAKSEWGPESAVRTFGSGASGLNLRGGDVDMCLVVPPQPLPKRQRRPRRGGNRSASVGKVGRGGGGGRGAVDYDDSGGVMSDKQIMRIMAQILRRSKMTIIQELLAARVPILKVMDPVSSFQLDICLNNELGHYNTNLLSNYASMDSRVRPLCLLVKYWAKRRGINDAYRGTLSSYAFVLLIIQFLQTRDRPVIPCLQRMVKGKAVEEGARLPVLNVDSQDGVSCNVHFDSSFARFDGGNDETLGELLVGFLYHYAFEFKYREQVACVRLGRLISKEEKEWDESSVSRLLERARLQAEAEEDEKESRIARRQARKEVGKATTVRNAPQMSLFNDQNFPSLGSTPPVGGSSSSSTGPGAWNTAAGAGLNGSVGAGPSSNDTDTDEDSAVNGARREAAERKIRKVTRHVFCIEDPFDLTHDLGRNIDAETLEVVRYEFIRAHAILVATGDIHRCSEKFEAADF